MHALTAEPTAYRGRPRYNGANINTYIGFKNFMFLAEDAVLEHFRTHGLGPQDLFTRYGLGLEVVDASTRLINTLHVDDEVRGIVESSRPRSGAGMVCKVRLDAMRPGGDVQVLTGKLRVALVQEKDGAGTEPVPADLAELVVPEVAAVVQAPPAEPAGTDAIATATPDNGFLWQWKIPYYYCHWYTRLQSNGYVRLLEEATDRYLEHAGLSITELLATRDWIPVVSRSRVVMHADAFMGETLLISYVVDDVIKDSVFTATMTCRVQRGEQLVTVATATIMHGYVLARGPEQFAGIVPLDADTQRALLTGK